MNITSSCHWSSCSSGISVTVTVAKHRILQIIKCHLLGAFFKAQPVTIYEGAAIKVRLHVGRPTIEFLQVPVPVR